MPSPGSWVQTGSRRKLQLTKFWSNERDHGWKRRQRNSWLLKTWHPIGWKRGIGEHRTVCRVIRAHAYITKTTCHEYGVQHAPPNQAWRYGLKQTGNCNTPVTKTKGQRWVKIPHSGHLTEVWRGTVPTNIVEARLTTSYCTCQEWYTVVVRKPSIRKLVYSVDLKNKFTIQLTHSLLERSWILSPILHFFQKK